MKLREVISPWPPTIWACPGPTPSISEVGDLVIRNARIASTGRVSIHVDYRGGDCIRTQDFENAALAVRVYNALKASIGKRLADLSDLEI